MRFEYIFFAQLGLSLDEGAVLSDSMLDDVAVQVFLPKCHTFKTTLLLIGLTLLLTFFLSNQAVFATFISGDGGGKDGLEELQMRLRRISTCAQFSAA